MSKEDHSIQRGQEPGSSEYTFSGPLIDLLLDITPVMQRAGLNPQDFIGSVTSHAEDLGTELVRDANAFSVLDPEFSKLSERDQRDIIYTAQDKTYGRYFHVMLRDLKKEAENGSGLAKQKHRELIQALGVREERERKAEMKVIFISRH